MLLTIAPLLSIKSWNILRPEFLKFSVTFFKRKGFLKSGLSQPNSIKDSLKEKVGKGNELVFFPSNYNLSKVSNSKKIINSNTCS